jgi:CheY-like chemotaxis protein
MMKKILYIEDQPAQRDTITQMLELGGFEVAAAEDGLAGIDKAFIWQPDLILMDLRMPRLDGYEAIRKLRTAAEMSDVPIIVLSAQSTGNDRDKALEAGANAFIAKPIDLRHLVDTIINFLEQS